MSERDDDRARIRAVLKTINDAWLNAKPEDLPRLMSGCFHDKALFRDGDFNEVARGADACIASYQAFLRAATVSACTLGEPRIDLAGDAAVATYEWTISYTLEGKEHREAGHDIFVLTQDDAARWFVRWRSMLRCAARSKALTAS